MTYLFALTAAFAYGAGDFLGGIGARKGSWTLVALIAQLAGVAPLLLAALYHGGTITDHDLMWSLGAGVGSGVGVSLLYRALALGQMAVVAPITALCAILLPCLASIVLGNMPSAIALLGIAAAIPALLLISVETPPEGAGETNLPMRKDAIIMALVAGVGLAAVYICLKQTGPQSGLWPAFWSRATASGVVLLYMVVSGFGRGGFSLGHRAAALAVGAGVLDGTANILLLLAVQQGDLATVATLTSLYPAATILLAAFFLKERISGKQKIGLILAVLSASAIAGAS